MRVEVFWLKSGELIAGSESYEVVSLVGDMNAEVTDGKAQQINVFIALFLVKILKSVGEKV